MSSKKFPLDYKYVIANPLIDKEKQNEMINRAIGYLYWKKSESDKSVSWVDDKIVKDLLTNDKYTSSFPFPPDLEQRLASWALALLGERIRELTEQQSSNTRS